MEFEKCLTGFVPSAEHLMFLLYRDRLYGLLGLVQDSDSVRLFHNHNVLRSAQYFRRAILLHAQFRELSPRKVCYPDPLSACDLMVVDC